MMKKNHHNRFFAIHCLFLCAILVYTPLVSQKKLQNSPGGYHGELDFPISWNRYYSVAEWTKIMKDLQKKYAHLAEVESIGKSRMGRDQYLLIISAKSTGRHSQKLAMWVDGAVHGNEVNGISCSLYLAWYLLTRYDYDPYVYSLLNNNTFYILPGLNVDANDSYVRFPNTPHNPREPYRPEDNDGDGLYDEDRTEDVDGDGELSIMYIEDPRGEYKLSPDKKQFIKVDNPNEQIQRFRRLGPEGFDNDGDGKINEDDIGGPDPNRNYPSGWNLQAGNPYPMSEPCTRNAYEFMLGHTNIFAGFHYHNTGRLIMFTRPPVVKAINASPRQLQYQQERYRRELEGKRKKNKYAQVLNINVSPSYQEDLRAQTEIISMGARILKNYRPVPTGGSGMAPSSTYDMLGAYAYLIELWGSPVSEADMDSDGRVSNDEYLKWIEIELTGEGWIIPHKYLHPDYGQIWIGGSRKKHISRTPPSWYIVMEAFKNALFVMYCVSQFPKIEISEIQVFPAAGNLIWVDTILKNDRIYPTISDRSIQLKRDIKDKLIFRSSNNISLVQLPKGKSQTVTDIPLGKYELIKKNGQEFRLKGKESKRFRILAKIEGSKGWVEIKTAPQFGKPASKRINIQIKK